MYSVLTKIRCASLATKIFKNIGILFNNYRQLDDNYRQFQGGIWYWCHITFRHRPINAQKQSCWCVTSQLFFCPFFFLSSFVRESHQIDFNVLRTFHRISLPPVEHWCSAEQTIGFDPRYFVPLLHLPLATASKHCLWQGMGDKAKG